jgi:hypothetical protein
LLENNEPQLRRVELAGAGSPGTFSVDTALPFAPSITLTVLPLLLLT